MSNRAIANIKRELETFPPDDQEQLGGDFVSYLRRLREIRQEIAVAERDLEADRLADVAELDRAIEVLRRRYAGG